MAAYLSGEPRYTLGCHGVFGTMGVDPTEVCLSIPGEQVPTLCEVLELWRERGKEMFREVPPNEEREYIRVPSEGTYNARARIDFEMADKDVSAQRQRAPYVPWAKRRKKKT